MKKIEEIFPNEKASFAEALKFLFEIKFMCNEKGFLIEHTKVHERLLHREKLSHSGHYPLGTEWYNYNDIKQTFFEEPIHEEQTGIFYIKKTI